MPGEIVERISRNPSYESLVRVSIAAAKPVPRIDSVENAVSSVVTRTETSSCADTVQNVLSSDVVYGSRSLTVSVMTESAACTNSATADTPKAIISLAIDNILSGRLAHLLDEFYTIPRILGKFHIYFFKQIKLLYRTTEANYAILQPMGRRKRKAIGRQRRVLVVVSMQSGYGPAVTNGIFRHLGPRPDWGIELIRSPKDFTVPALTAALEHRTEGAIVSLPGADPSALALLVESGIPIVTVDLFEPVLARRQAKIANIRIDNRAIGRLAARSLLRQGVYNGFGFIPEDGNLDWSRQREEAFRDELDAADFFCETFPCVGRGAVDIRGYLAKWLRHLPKPAAVMAAHDILAFEAVQAAAAAKLRVPQDVAVIGVDDDRLLCMNATPTISSISPGFEAAGELAARTLGEMMGRPDSRRWEKPLDILSKHPSEVVRRGSTVPDSEAGRLVQRAIAFIENNVMQGIGVRDVVAYLGVSRSLADLRFREVRKSTILDAIVDRRLEELKRRLATTDEPIAALTGACGWKSPNYPKNLFKRRFGLSMSDYRATQRRLDGGS